MTTPYRHGSLDLKVPSFRLLYLQPGEDDEPIAGKLIVSRLDEHQYFTALSYTWGDPTVGNPILIDGHAFDVTANLHDALKVLRPSPGSEVEPMWIDAICINQQDIAERNHQVRQMGKLYINAGRVITWLGQADEDSDLAMEYLASFSNAWSPPKTLPQNEARGFAIARLMSRPYWNRVWIVQEVAFGSPHSYIACGKRIIDWECVDDMRFQMENVIATKAAFGGTRVVDSIIQRVLAASNCRQMVMDGFCYASLRDLLKLTRSRQATDPRDKVFAILGLAGDDMQKSIIPDYEMSLKKVFILATAKAMEEARKKEKINLLCEAGHGRWDELPSWLPDWSSPADHPQLSPVHYNASANYYQVPEITGDVLSVKAIVMDQIADFCGQIFDGSNWEVINDMETVARQAIQVYIDGELLKPGTKDLSEDQSMARLLGSIISPWFEEYFWRTLLANVDLDGNYPAPDVYGIGLGLMRSWTASSQASSPTFTHSRTEPKSEIISMQQSSAALKVDHFLPNLPPDYLPELPPTERCEKLELLVTRACELALRDRRFFITEQGLMGLGPPSLRVDDLICLIVGGDTPFVLREDSMTTHDSLDHRSRFVRLIGPAYVHTTMSGEVADALGNGAPLTQFKII